MTNDNFKIGDIVRVVDSPVTGMRPIIGKVGKIVYINGSNLSLDMIEDISHIYTHDCSGLSRMGHGLHMDTRYVEKVNEGEKTLKIVMHDKRNNYPEINANITSNGVSINSKNFDILEDVGVKQLDVIQALLRDNYEIVKPKPKLPIYITSTELREKRACDEGYSFFIRSKEKYERLNTGHYPTIDFLGALLLEGKLDWYEWMVIKFELERADYSSRAGQSDKRGICLGHYLDLKKKYKEQENENK